MPRTSVPADMQLRPDLRLGASDAAVRRVSAVALWFERMAGLSSADANVNRDGHVTSETCLGELRRCGLDSGPSPHHTTHEASHV